MNATVAEPRRDRWRLQAVRLQLGLVALLVGLAAVAWWWTEGRMSGMDDGPWTSLGGAGWFLSVWVAMMAAMMFPSAAPTVALYAKLTGRRSPLGGLAFAGGYLLTWAAAGVAAYVAARTGGAVSADVLDWDRAGRWVAVGTLAAAAVYQLTPLKDACLGKCRSPLAQLLGAWRGGVRGAVAMGCRNGAWCIGCCWALMASLFALGLMSLVWMAFVSALIAIEKLVRWQRAATYGTAAILLGLALFLAWAPDALPGLTIPAGGMRPTMGMGG